MRTRRSRLGAHGPLEPKARRREIAALERHHSQVFERNAAVGVDREDALERPRGFVPAARPDVGDAERVQRFGVRAGIAGNRLEEAD
jgi:hypothetical protein